MLATVQHNELSKDVVGEYGYAGNSNLSTLYLRESRWLPTYADVVYIGDVRDGPGSLMVGSGRVLDTINWMPLYKGDTITIKL